MKYRKKPIVIEAFRYTGRDSVATAPAWLDEAVARGVVGYERTRFGSRVVALIHTPEGVMTAQQGDWIIRGVQGELYPCKPDIFEDTYERVEEPE